MTKMSERRPAKTRGRSRGRDRCRNLDTMIHLMKGNVGTGILAMPDTFKNAGLVVATIGTLLMGIICPHCIHMLVKCSHELCQKIQVPALDFSEVCETAFQTGPSNLQKYS